MDIFIVLYYHSLLSFEWRLHHCAEVSKFNAVDWVEREVRELIEFLAMCEGVYMKRNCVFICVCCFHSSLNEVVPFFVPQYRRLILWRGMCQSMSCNGRVRYSGLERANP